MRPPVVWCRPPSQATSTSAAASGVRLTVQIAPICERQQPLWLVLQPRREAGGEAGLTSTGGRAWSRRATCR